jgi:parallel beta-helix repeat protein
MYVNLFVVGSIVGYFERVYGSDDSCITFDSKTRLISISCKSARLSDIDKQLNNPSILKRESFDSDSDKFDSTSSKGWLLNAGITVAKNATLIIDSIDTSWLKIVPVATVQLSSESKTTKEQEQNVQISLKSNLTTGSLDSNQTGIIVDSINNENKSRNDQVGNLIVTSKNNDNNPNGIHVLGSLIIDSVKITSWDPKKNDVVKFNLGKRPGEEDTKSEYDTVEPRPFIRVSDKASGTTNITNSEISYLGYSCSKCSGLSYYGGIGSVINGNDIHHLLKGFYSKKMGYMVIENNDIHDNYLYGIDPHTGTHDMVIRNNKVHHNNATAVVCSKDCYNILIEGNEVYDNLDGHRGIAYSINSDHSIIQNNYVHDQDICIGSNRLSDYNKIYNNTLSNCRTGIDLTDTSHNIVSDNKIIGAQNALILQNSTNKIFNNKIYNSTNGIVFAHPSNNSDSINSNSNTYFLDQVNLSNEVKGTKNPFVIISDPIKIDSETHLTDLENETMLSEGD